MTIVGSALVGAVVPEAYWTQGAGVEAHGDFLIADIPVDAVPENVLERLAKLG